MKTPLPDGRGPDMDKSNSQLFRFDLRILALDKLKNEAEETGFIYYRNARAVLGRALHLPKRESRRLLLEMAKSGLIRFDMKGRIFFKSVREWKNEGS